MVINFHFLGTSNTVQQYPTIVPPIKQYSPKVETICLQLLVNSWQTNYLQELKIYFRLPYVMATFMHYILATTCGTRTVQRAGLVCVCVCVCVGGGGGVLCIQKRVN